MATFIATEPLRREIGIVGLSLAIINMVVGSGIFALPAIVAEGLGAAAILAYLCCAVLVLLLGLCFTEVGSQVNTSGGVYKYIERAFGHYAGFLAAGIYLLGAAVVSDAAIANVLADTLRIFFPTLGIETNRMFFMLVVFLVLAWINISSVKNGLGLVVLTGAVKLAALILLVIFAMRQVEPANLGWLKVPRLQQVGTATLLLFFTFQGFEVPLSNGGEIRTPARTIPLGLLGGMLAVLLVYISLQMVAQGVLGLELTGHREAPLAAVANQTFGAPGNDFYPDHHPAIYFRRIKRISPVFSQNCFCRGKKWLASRCTGPRAPTVCHPAFGHLHLRGDRLCRGHIR